MALSARRMAAVRVRCSSGRTGCAKSITSCVEASLESTLLQLLNGFRFIDLVLLVHFLEPFLSLSRKRSGSFLLTCQTSDFLRGTLLSFAGNRKEGRIRLSLFNTARYCLDNHAIVK